MLQVFYALCILTSVYLIKCDREAFVVGGKRGKIRKFPHAVFLKVACNTERGMVVPWICGASIVNEKITLTAAHCVADCYKMTHMSISAGHSNIKSGLVSTVYGYFAHQKYHIFGVDYDIALIKVKTPFKFSDRVKRVVLLQNPPYNEVAQVAGWGFINEEMSLASESLQYVNQYVWKTKKCRTAIESLPKGTICADSRSNNSFVSGGDSGSALVVRGYIQIGIVSYKMPKISRSLVVYTETAYFYDWIKTNSRRLYCA